MRKLFWGLTAVSVVAAGGMFWLKWQGPTLSHSIAAQAANGGNSGILSNALSGTAAVLGGGSDAAVNSDDDLAHFQKPDDPVEIVESKTVTIDPDVAGVIDFHPTPVAPTITIHDPIEVSKPAGVADSGSYASDFTVGAAAKVDPAIIQVNVTAIGLAHGEIQTVPRVMPYAVDDDDEAPPLPKMQYAVEDFVPKASDNKDKAAVFSFWSSLFHSDRQQMCGDGSETVDPVDHHAHDSYCPYTGRCLPAPKPYVEPTKETPRGGDENSEPTPTLKKKTSLMSPYRDTLEFRTSDHSDYERKVNSI